MHISLDKAGKERTQSSAASTAFVADRDRRSLDDKRLAGQPKGHFVHRYGQRHHSFDNEKAPYPMSYNRDMLETEALDNEFIRFLKDAASFVHFKEEPSRVLDLGCGTGTWIVHAAKEWPSCTFVGFDLVNVQIPIESLDSNIRKRVKWRHGNFLTTQLPFEEDEFDHIHIQFVAKGVPENKWNYLFNEVNRVLRPGGSIEIIEEDFVFPLLPKWFTKALRDHTRQESSVDEPLPFVPAASQNALTHDHALLESLMASVFEERFIHVKPTAVLPGYFTSYFRQVVIGPVIQFPMPPLALPLRSTTPNNPHSHSDTSDNAPLPGACQRPPSRLTLGPASLNTDEITARAIVPQSPSHHAYHDNTPFKKFIIDDEKENKWPHSLIPLDRLDALNERSLSMQLYKSYQTVLACQEAMWDELMFRLSNKKDELSLLGWNDKELGELHARQKFEMLLGRFRSDVQARLAMWSSLTECGFDLPRQEPLSKVEYMKEFQRRKYLMEACEKAAVEEAQEPCRTLRVLIGYK
ncbi:S-adenosyl-L-methionine-dependent methyltransferase [Amanita rubescens]|nr:S-adenosyl-L-methionine-dependent methyltransferase [Amanita rubescens]